MAAALPTLAEQEMYSQKAACNVFVRLRSDTQKFHVVRQTAVVAVCIHSALEAHTGPTTPFLDCRYRFHSENF